MKKVFSRIVAYTIDAFIITVISTLITSNSYINKDYKKSIELSENYEVVYEEYEDSMEELNNLKENDKISQKEYDKKIKKIEEEYKEENIDYSYKFVKYSVIPTIINIMLILLYFVVIQFYFNGQTIGKWIMKLRIVSNNDSKLTMLNFFVRSVVLNGLLTNLISVILIITLSKSNYLVASEVIFIIEYIIEMCIIFMLCFNKNNRGLHDIISNTKVISENKTNELIKEKNT